MVVGGLRRRFGIVRWGLVVRLFIFWICGFMVFVSLVDDSFIFRLLEKFMMFIEVECCRSKDRVKLGC